VSEKETKSVASETDVPAGLDVVPMEPGTIVGGRDLQGADGTPRTDRPGEILGTPVEDDAQRRLDAAQRETDRADFQTQEVDWTNRNELPLLGGPNNDDWKPEGHTTGDYESSIAEGTRTAERSARGTTTTDAARTTARAADADATPAAPRGDGIKVAPKVDRG
jgi:hypothetical protein